MEAPYQNSSMEKIPNKFLEKTIFYMQKANEGFTKKIATSAGSIQWMICWRPKTRGDERKP